MYTFKGALFTRFLESAESFRRGQAGALMMGMFITADTAPYQTTLQNIATLKYLANLCLVMLDELPGPVRWAATPFIDYSKSLI